MQSSIPLLSLAIWVPIVFGFLILALGEDRHAGVVRGLSLVGAIAERVDDVRPDEPSPSGDQDADRLAHLKTISQS